jgi:type III restriction enzyme
VLDKFCLDQLSQWEKYTSLGVLRNALLEALEELFAINEYEGIKVILYHLNQPKFVDVIQDTLNEYKKSLTLRKASQRKQISYIWEVPEDRIYNEKENFVNRHAKNHALMPFIQEQDPSTPEQHFVDFLEKNSSYIDWWYKNGDSGSMHYAVSYINVEGEQSLFYVDFVIRMKNGQIFLFDTKSAGSDKNGKNKHNALIDYMASPTNKDKHLKGGIIIEDKFGVWRYSPLKIENTDDLAGWDAFFPDQIN